MQSTAPSGHTPQRLELGGPSNASADEARRGTVTAESFATDGSALAGKNDMTPTLGEIEPTSEATRASDAGRRVAYTVREVALLLGLSRGSAYALVREGRIPALRMGGRWIVPKRRFHAWLDARPETAELQSEAAP